MTEQNPANVWSIIRHAATLCNTFFEKMDSGVTPFAFVEGAQIFSAGRNVQSRFVGEKGNLLDIHFYYAILILLTKITK